VEAAAPPAPIAYAIVAPPVVAIVDQIDWPGPPVRPGIYWLNPEAVAADEPPPPPPIKQTLIVVTFAGTVYEVPEVSVTRFKVLAVNEE
jgi:hypothetical protein